jgi:hypothetical protein
MAQKAMGTGLDAAIAWYNANVDSDCPMFSIWSGKDLFCSYIKDDAEQSLEHFTNNITGLIEQGFNDIIVLRSHFCTKQDLQKYPFITAKTPVTSTFYFRPVALTDRPFFDANKSEYNVIGQETIHSKLARIEEKLSNSDEDIDEEENEHIGNIPATPKVDIYTILNTFVQNPILQEAIIGKVLGFLGVNNTPGPKATALAGIPQHINMSQHETEQAIEAINILKLIRPQIVGDLITLANISQTDPPKAQMILSMLPK